MVDYIGYWIFTKEDQCTGTVTIHYLLFATQEWFQINFTFSKLKGGRSTNAITVI